MNKYNIIYISPHLDDAIFSCAGTILEHVSKGLSVLIITVFGRGKSTQHISSKFADYQTRILEDERAIKRVGADALRLDQPELIYRKLSPRNFIKHIIPTLSLRDTDAFADADTALNQALKEHATTSSRIFFPLAIGGHPDHRIVFELGRALSRTRDVTYYEDIPYAYARGLSQERYSQLGMADGALHQAACGFADLAFRGPAWLVCYFMVVLVLIFGRIFRSGLKLDSILEERDISPHQETRVKAVSEYSSQIPLFFPGQRGLLSQLGSPSGCIERSWKLGP